MKICKYCGKSMKDEEGFCPFCGYDPKTDRISPKFKQQLESGKESKQRVRLQEQKANAAEGINPRVKMFAFIGLVVFLFSIFYKNNFSISGVTSEIKHYFSRLKAGKLTIEAFSKKQDKPVNKVELVDISSFEVPQEAMVRRDLMLEGISFDPGYKSFVIINGKVLSEGESLGSVLVKKINKDSVEVVVDGESKILNVQSAPLSTKEKTIKENLGGVVQQIIKDK